MIYSTFVAFDLETTGLKNDKDEIVEIGAVKFTVYDDNGVIRPKEISTFQSLVKPPMMIPDELNPRLVRKMAPRLPGS